MQNLTETEKEYLTFIEHFIKIHGYPPSIRDIANSLYVSKTTAHRHLSTLVDKEYLRYTPRIARSYTLKERT